MILTACFLRLFPRQFASAASLLEGLYAKLSTSFYDEFVSMHAGFGLFDLYARTQDGAGMEDTVRKAFYRLIGGVLRSCVLRSTLVSPGEEHSF